MHFLVASIKLPHNLKNPYWNFVKILHVIDLRFQNPRPFECTYCEVLLVYKKRKYVYLIYSVLYDRLKKND